jgi:hypothetical protein
VILQQRPQGFGDATNSAPERIVHRPVPGPSTFRNRLGTQQTAYPRLPDPNALQEKFYWCTVTPTLKT